MVLEYDTTVHYTMPYDSGTMYPPTILYYTTTHHSQHNIIEPILAMENCIYKITHSWIFIVSKGWFFLQLNVSSCDLFSGCWVTCCNFPKKMSSDLLLFPFLTAVVSFCQPLFYANFCIPKQFSAICTAKLHICGPQLYFKFHCFCVYLLFSGKGSHFSS